MIFVSWSRYIPCSYSWVCVGLECFLVITFRVWRSYGARRAINYRGIQIINCYPTFITYAGYLLKYIYSGGQYPLTIPLAANIPPLLSQQPT